MVSGDVMMEGVWLPQARYRGYSPLRETPREYFECLEDCGDCQDELFLLPERALDMDSYTLREDLSSIVPSYRWGRLLFWNFQLFWQPGQSWLKGDGRILKSFFGSGGTTEPHWLTWGGCGWLA